MSSENISETHSDVPDIELAEKQLHEHDVETTACFVMYYSYGVGKSKSKVRGRLRWTLVTRGNVKWKDAGV